MNLFLLLYLSAAKKLTFMRFNFFLPLVVVLLCFSINLQADAPLKNTTSTISEKSSESISTTQPTDSVKNVGIVKKTIPSKEKQMEKAEDSFFDALFGYPLVALFAIIALGLGIGKITYKGLSLGASGVLFVALMFGHMGYSIPKGIGSVGLVLFVFCIGITAGPSFFAAFAKKGADLAKLSIIAVTIGTLITYMLAKLTNIPTGLASGLLAGALTSTPGLASAMEAMKGDAGMVSIGYGIAYPFGVVGVVLFIQLMPKFLGVDLNKEAEKIDNNKSKSETLRVLVQVSNSLVVGKLISDVMPFMNKMKSCISRVMIDDKLAPITKDYKFIKDDIVLIVGDSDQIEFAIEHIGEMCDKKIIIDSDNERMQIAVTSKELCNLTLSELQPLQNYNVTISRVTRHDLTFLADDDTLLEYGDLLTVVGTPDDLHKFAKFAGNKHKILHSTDIISLAVGITLGVILGKIPIQLPGLKAFSLGMAGGPLFVALVMGYFKKIGNLTTRIPMASKVLLMDIGLLFFLANAGIKAGGQIMPVLEKHGISLFFTGAAITLIPMIVTFFIAIKLFKMNILESLGGICGGMTSTPALGAISAKVDSEIPVTSYATAYPVALILMTIAVQILVSILT